MPPLLIALAGAILVSLSLKGTPLGAQLPSTLDPHGTSCPDLRRTLRLAPERPGVLEAWARACRVGGAPSAASGATRGSEGGAELPASFAWGLTDPGVRFFYQSEVPPLEDEGPIWVGRGATVALDGGVRFAWGALGGVIHPILSAAENRDFPLLPVRVAGRPRYGYPWGWGDLQIDRPQRFGPDPVFAVDPGPSEIHLSLGKVRVGAGTAVPRWGPSLRNPILLGTGAPGFPHAFVTVGDPQEKQAGAFGGRWMWGRLSESGWFREEGEDPGRYFTGLFLHYAPPFLEGLTVGAGRVFYQEIGDRGIPAGDVFLVFQGVRKKDFADDENPHGDDVANQMVAAFFDWSFPEVGFEVWGEWGRDDHGWDFRDYFVQVEHANGFTAGMRKVIEVSDDLVGALEVEVTNLERSRSHAARIAPTWYAHHVATAGYTHRGRVLGAPIGPGGASQHAAAHLFTRWGRGEIFARRRVLDNDGYYHRAEEGEADLAANAVLDLGGSWSWFRGPLELRARTTVSWVFNRGSKAWDDVRTLGLRLESRWRPSHSLSP